MSRQPSLFFLVDHFCCFSISRFFPIIKIPILTIFVVFFLTIFQCGTWGEPRVSVRLGLTESNPTETVSRQKGYFLRNRSGMTEPSPHDRSLRSSYAGKKSGGRVSRCWRRLSRSVGTAINLSKVVITFGRHVKDLPSRTGANDLVTCRTMAPVYRLVRTSPNVPVGRSSTGMDEKRKTKRKKIITTITNFLRVLFRFANGRFSFRPLVYY